MILGKFYEKFRSVSTTDRLPSDGDGCSQAAPAQTGRRHQSGGTAKFTTVQVQVGAASSRMVEPGRHGGNGSDTTLCRQSMVSPAHYGWVTDHPEPRALREEMSVHKLDHNRCMYSRCIRRLRSMHLSPRRNHATRNRPCPPATLLLRLLLLCAC